MTSVMIMPRSQRDPSLRHLKHRNLAPAIGNPLSDFEAMGGVQPVVRYELTTDASAPFNLGNLLRGCARNVEAEVALRAAARVDPTFADACYNLSDLLDEQGRVEAAIECLRTALRVAPEYSDATFNLALLLQRTNRFAEAADYWRRYLASDRQSEWAARARRSLKFCEMQVNFIASA